MGFFWALGIFLASFWGLGWLFVFITIKRLINHIPILQNGLKSMLGVEPLPGEIIEKNNLPEAFGIHKWIILLGWAAITILVFCKLNYPLIDLIKMK